MKGCIEVLDCEGSRFLTGVSWGCLRGLLGLSRAVRVLMRDSYTTPNSGTVQVVLALPRLSKWYEMLTTP